VHAAPELLLRLTRAEIALYLGLSQGTVCRLFSHLQHAGLIRVRGRNVQLVDGDGLRGFVNA
jgi:CRP/FNR family transcriptional regulator